MAGGDETRDDEWGDKTARKTFLVTVIGALLFVGVVVIFILNADVGR